MKFSVIVPIHNAAETLEKCIDSILRQARSEFDIEVILVLNDCEDCSPEICQKKAKENREVIVVLSEKKGVSRARNRGLEVATGDVICFCDADDWLEDDAFYSVYSILNEQNGLKMVVTAYQNIYANQSISIHRISREKTVLFEDLIPSVVYDQNIMGIVCNKFFLKEIIEENRFAEELEYCEDMAFVVRILAKNRKAKAYVSTKVTYDYVQNFSSATRDVKRMFNKNELKYFAALEHIKSFEQISKREQAILNREEYILAVEHYFLPIDEQKRCRLRVYMKKHWRSFLLFGHLQLRKSIIIMAKSIFVLLDSFNIVKADAVKGIRRRRGNE